MKKTRIRYMCVTMAMTSLLWLPGCGVNSPSLENTPQLLVTEGASPPMASEPVVTLPEETVLSTACTEEPTAETTLPAEPTEIEEKQTEPPKEQRKEKTSQQTAPPATQPKETEPPQTEYAEMAPPATEPHMTKSPTTQPLETEPPQTEPKETEPVETAPLETAPEETETSATEPTAEVIDVAALAAYGRSYAASAYGYEGNPNCNPSTNAGYFPGVREVITTMEEGYAAAREAVDYQYACDASMGRTIYKEIDGVIQRRNINLYFEPTDDPNVFIVWCYYGGEA